MSNDLNTQVLSKWTELKTLVEGLELDANKNAKGNAAAGVRLRKGLRQLQHVAKDYVKLTIEADKAAKSED